MKKNHLLTATIICFISILGITGCKKDSNLKSLSNPQLNLDKISSDSMVMTPNGLYPKSHVFVIENGYHLEIQNSRVLKVEDKSHNQKDLAAILHPSLVSPSPQPSLLGRNLSLKQKNGPLGTISNYQAYANWQNTSGVPINYFSTTWVVPTNPTTTDNSYFYIFNALTPAEYSAEIMQPVLQWGSGQDGGGSYWAIANWYGWSDGTNHYFAVTSRITVTPGTTITGTIINTGNSGGSQNYTCSFSGSSGQYNNVLTIVKGDQYSGFENKSTTPTTVTIPTVSQESWAYEALEAYNGSIHGGYDVIQPQDYPVDFKVKMSNIKLLTNNSPASLLWDAETGLNAYFQESAVDVSNDASGSGEVDLYFHPDPNINHQYSSFTLSQSGNSNGVIYSDPGKLIHITLSAQGAAGYYHSAACLVSGATLSGPMGNNMEVANGSLTETFTMPSSGQVTFNMSFSENDSTGSATVSVY